MKISLRVLMASTILTIVGMPSHTYAQLSVQDPLIYGTKQGYIDQATLVVEPHGGYVEQSLYLKYSDHNQYPGNQKIEIVHRFTLPQGSVVNDMWLWIGDQVMKAKMFDTWTARHIYDSIVVRGHDPAFLAKNGDTYELHIYPLVSGLFRKAKLNFISPTRWIGNSGSAELPLQFLKANNATTKPLEILFREQVEIWGSPAIAELPQLTFKRVVDTAGFIYRNFELTDISALPSLSVSFQTNFINGIFAMAGDKSGDSSFFQVGVDPASFHMMRSDTGANSVVVGLDFSGNYNKDLGTTISNVGKVLHRALRPIDRFRLTVSGAGTLQHYSSWRNADSVTIDTVLQNFVSSPFAATIIQQQKPTIVFCDYDALTIWSFPGLDSLAVVESYPDINKASSRFSSVDIVASYDHGYENAFATDDNLPDLLSRIDSLLLKGGRFLGFYDYNRGADEIDPHYINGLSEKAHEHTQTLIRQQNGNISSGFPQSITVNTMNYLNFSDSTTKIELANSQGDAAVLSKRVKNGLVIVSGIWSYNDDGAMKQMLAVPLLGVSQIARTPQMLLPLLNDLQSSLSKDTIREVIIFSNADSVISQSSAEGWINNYISSITGTAPVFHTVNLLDGKLFTPGYITVNSTDYYGSGYLAYLLSNKTRGIHFESHLEDWNYIAGTLTYSTSARLDSLNLQVTVDNGAGKLLEMGEVGASKLLETREVALEPNDPNKPRFFIGMSNASKSLTFDFDAQFKGTSQHVARQAVSYILTDTTKRTPIIASMLGWEELQDYFQTSSYDTTTIVNRALKYNLLCDYTALIALEPSDKNPPLLNPLDESKIFNTPIKNKKSHQDSLLFSVYPNPFNNQTIFCFNLPQISNVKIQIYNLLGQVIKTFTSNGIYGQQYISWDGTDENKKGLASGIFYVRAIIKEQISGKIQNRTTKLLMLK